MNFHMHLFIRQVIFDWERGGWHPGPTICRVCTLSLNNSPSSWSVMTLFHYVSQVGLKRVILLPQPPEYEDDHKCHCTQPFKKHCQCLLCSEHYSRFWRRDNGQSNPFSCELLSFLRYLLSVFWRREVTHEQPHHAGWWDWLRIIWKEGRIESTRKLESGAFSKRKSLSKSWTQERVFSDPASFPSAP